MENEILNVPAPEPAMRYLAISDDLILTLYPEPAKPGPADREAKPRQVRKLTARRVRELLDCDPEAGTLTWRPRPDCPAFKFAGRRAGTFDRSTGYRRVMIDGHYYYEHVVVWVHAKGYGPPCQLDHKNGDRCANWIGNLRPATSSQQTQNQRRHADARNPVKGCEREPDGKWRATIVRQGQRIWLGRHATLAEAAAARRKAEEDLFDPAFRRVELRVEPGSAEAA
jgi:hypothetical protein